MDPDDERFREVAGLVVASLTAAAAGDQRMAGEILLGFVWEGKTPQAQNQRMSLLFGRMLGDLLSSLVLVAATTNTDLDEVLQGMGISAAKQRGEL